MLRGACLETMAEQGSCEICDGIGLLRTATGSQVCGCQAAKRLAALKKRTRIPAGFEHATLDSFVSGPKTVQALMAAKQFVKEFIPGQATSGLLFTGSVGTGKTHLAVGMLLDLAAEKGIEGRFVDVRELLDRLRSSYDNNAQETQAQILKPLLTADLVVIDELGAARPSDWVFETIELLIGGLYNRVIPTVVTTNLANLGPGASLPAAANEYARAARAETLGDRIGTRMWSRLQQMCRSVEMSGTDWRMKR